MSASARSCMLNLCTYTYLRRGGNHGHIPAVHVEFYIACKEGQGVKAPFQRLA